MRSVGKRMCLRPNDVSRTMPTSDDSTATTTSSTQPFGRCTRGRPVWPSRTALEHQRDDVHDETDRAVERDRADRVALRHTAALEVAHVDAHAAEAGGRDLVAEAARELGDERAPVRERHEHRARQRQRGREERADRREQREHEPSELGVARRVEGLLELADLRAAADTSRRGGTPSVSSERSADARERLELDVLGADRVGRAVADLVEQPVTAAQRAPRLGRERERLQQRQRRRSRPACRASRPRRRPPAARRRPARATRASSATSCASARSLAPASAYPKSTIHGWPCASSITLCRLRCRCAIARRAAGARPPSTAP